MTKADLTAIVTGVMSAEGTKEELDALTESLELNLPHPELSDLIFFPDRLMTVRIFVAAP